ncbi:hypothetical protein PPERSA_10833 [Pseudocohnilembus persalinus]|uniref:Uncharacterized protein n=1 Tax=Pseudocohnilembus persalinus TaxID=266149 RepID=A0A0V0QDQ2_PSEPJ|nr:hypothetical protein PPERSA_10833 [Pseudocohnilembus persalinus]|eukprot:KRX00334.1 hypothetical protein PPERSA_10833 [Pseudocohnilembus persalinus]
MGLCTSSEEDQDKNRSNAQSNKSFFLFEIDNLKIIFTKEELYQTNIDTLIVVQDQQLSGKFNQQTKQILNKIDNQVKINEIKNDFLQEENAFNIHKDEIEQQNYIDQTERARTITKNYNYANNNNDKNQNRNISKFLSNSRNLSMILERPPDHAVQQHNKIQGISNSSSIKQPIQNSFQNTAYLNHSNLKLQMQQQQLKNQNAKKSFTNNNNNNYYDSQNRLTEQSTGEDFPAQNGRQKRKKNGQLSILQDNLRETKNISKISEVDDEKDRDSQINNHSNYKEQSFSQQQDNTQNTNNYTNNNNEIKNHEKNNQHHNNIKNNDINNDISQTKQQKNGQTNTNKSSLHQNYYNNNRFLSNSSFLIPQNIEFQYCFKLGTVFQLESIANLQKYLINAVLESYKGAKCFENKDQEIIFLIETFKSCLILTFQKLQQKQIGFPLMLYNQTFLSQQEILDIFIYVIREFSSEHKNQSCGKDKEIIIQYQEDETLKTFKETQTKEFVKQKKQLYDTIIDTSRSENNSYLTIRNEDDQIPSQDQSYTPNSQPNTLNQSQLKFIHNL